MQAPKKVVLAYSGGLDTSVAVKWIGEEWGAEVVALAVDVGQTADDDWETIRQRALAAGAVEAIVVDARAEFADDYCLPALQANALYEGKYPLVSALSRPVIVKYLVQAAREHGADAVAHGCTGKGNDQVRFEVSTRALAPELDVLAPVRVWGFTREDSIDYAAKHGIPIKVRKDNPYSIDENLWGRAIECGAMEDPWATPPEEPFTLTNQTATEPWELTLRFEAGVPVALDHVVDLVDVGAVRELRSQAERAREVRRDLGDEAPELLARATRRQILVRMLLNLKRLYVSWRSFPQARVVTDLLLALSPSALSELRDRGLLAYHMNDFSAALRDLEEYLKLSKMSESDEEQRRENQEVWEHVKALRRRVASLN